MPAYFVFLPDVGSQPRPTRIQSTNVAIDNFSSPSNLEPQCHPCEPQVTKEVEDYFIQHWRFPDDVAVEKFRAAGFSRVTCYYFPEALNARIGFAARLLTLLFLIDGIHICCRTSVDR